MEWEEAIEEAKEELGIHGYTDNWNEVVDLAKEKYWNGESFKQLKEETINFANNKCELCSSKERLTAHHISYGKEEYTMCVCNKCHKVIHSLNHYGFVLQLLLLHITHNFEIPPNLQSICSSVNKELIKKVDEGFEWK